MTLPGAHERPKFGSDVDPAAGTSSSAEEVPDLTRTTKAFGSPRSRSVGVTILTVLALLYTLYFARPFLLPVTFALLFNFLLSPVVRALARARVPPPVGAGLVILALLGIVGLSAYELSGPVQTWVTKAPSTLAVTQTKLRRLLRPIERVTKTAEQVENATNTDGATTSSAVVVKGPSVASRLFGTTEVLLGTILEVSILLYFLLAAGDLFLQKLIKVLPELNDKRTAVEIARETEASISTYLLTAAAVNVGEGIVVTAVMYALGMPNPVLWGALVAVLEFIPYLGALTMIVILGVAGLTTFESLTRGLLIPASFLFINLIQGNFVTPVLLGHRLAVNPVAILVALAFWFWIWGVPGAFIAVPLLAAFKIFCDHIAPLASVGEFLGTRDDDERRTIVR
ncbi:MAG: AI-2E family transporter [Gemmatimonadaceae bacterium]